MTCQRVCGVVWCVTVHEWNDVRLEYVGLAGLCFVLPPSRYEIESVPILVSFELRL